MRRADNNVGANWPGDVGSRASMSTGRMSVTVSARDGRA